MATKKQIKSKKRVQEHGEVFTNDREVKAMCDLVLPETQRIDSRFLEPACGDGNFLEEILLRKLKIVRSKYKKSFIDYEKNSLLAVSSVYGVELMMDNVIICRERLYNIWNKEYISIFKDLCSEEMRNSIRFILSKNIVCGNALTLKTVDDNCSDTDVPIVFSEWGFVTGNNLSRKDYTMDELVNSDKKTPKQSSIFEDESSSDEGKFLGQVVCNYRRLSEYGK